MALNRRLEDGHHFGSEQNYGSEDDSAGVSALRKKELEVVVIDAVRQVIEPILESLISRVVKEEIKSSQEKFLTNMNWNTGSQIHPSESRSLQLRFLDKVSLPVFTGSQIKGEECTSIKVALVDGLTGKVVKSGPEASAKVKIVVLEGDFDGDEGHNWTLEEFNQKIVREWSGKKSLLTGNVYLNLKEGIGSVGKIDFTHNKNWMLKNKFRLGARIEDNVGGTRVREAKTDPFTVKDGRCKYNEKHHLPSLSDEVWRLKKIQKNGAFHGRLSKENIKTVGDFQEQFFKDPQRLRDILGRRMSDKMWEVTRDHALTCESPRLESIKGSVIETSDMVHDHTQPSTFPGIISSKNSIGDTSNVCMVRIGNMDFIYDPLSCPDQVSNSPIFESMNRDFDEDEHLWYLKAQRRWIMVSSMLRWFSIRKMVASKSLHVQKKQRFC